MNIGGHGSVIHLAPACIVAIWLSRFESTLIDDVVPVVGDRDESRKENNVSLKDRAGLLIGSLLDGLSLDMTMTRESSLLFPRLVQDSDLMQSFLAPPTLQ